MKVNRSRLHPGVIRIPPIVHVAAVHHALLTEVKSSSIAASSPSASCVSSARKVCGTVAPGSTIPAGNAKAEEPSPNCFTIKRTINSLAVLLHVTMTYDRRDRKNPDYLFFYLQHGPSDWSPREAPPECFPFIIESISYRHTLCQCQDSSDQLSGHGP